MSKGKKQTNKTKIELENKEHRDIEWIWLKMRISNK